MKIIFTGIFTSDEKDSIRKVLLQDNLNIEEYIRNRDFYINKKSDQIEVIRKNR